MVDLSANEFNVSPTTYVYLSDGRGSFNNSILTSLNSTARQVYFSDINDDSRSDLILITTSNKIQIRFSLGNGLFDNPITTTSSFSGTIYPVNLNGDGNFDLVSAQRIEKNEVKFKNYVSHVSNPQSDLLEKVNEDTGAEIKFTYKSSKPYTPATFPFVFQVVDSIAVNDGLGNTSTAQYEYAGGLYDYPTREFRGFTTINRTNPDGTIVQTQYHQDEFLKGRVEQEGLWAIGANPAVDVPLSLTTNTWETEYLDAPTNTTAFTKLSQTRTEHNDATTVFTQQDFTFDSGNGNPVSIITSGTGAENVTTGMEWNNYGDWLWRKTKETITGAVTGKVRESFFTYENFTGNLTVEEKWLSTGTNPRVTYQYDTYGNITYQTDARNNTTSISYDPATATFPVRIVYPATGGIDHIVEMAWDARFGQKILDKDENNQSTNYAYDPFGRIAQTDYPDGGQTKVIYFDDVVPRYTLTKVKENFTGTTIDSYHYLDGLNRGVQSVSFGENGKNIVRNTYYDEMGRAYFTEGPFFASSYTYPQTAPSDTPWTLTVFDDRSRPIAIDSPHGQYGTISTAMDYNGFNVTITDPDGSRKTEVQDYLGRISQVIEYNDIEKYFTNYTYNAAGDLTTVTDHLGNLTTVTWDTMGRKTAMDDPDMGIWSYTYDANGNMLTQTDAKNQVTTFTYDQLNRITGKSYNTPDPPVSYFYDNTTSGKNGIGRLRSVESSAAINTYLSYDAMGRLLEESKEINGDSTIYTTKYIYDLSGKNISTIQPDGTTVDNTFFPGTNLLSTVTGSGNVTYATLSDYAASGKIRRIDHGNNALTSYSYDPLSEKLTGIVTLDHQQQEIQNRSYLYSPAGDIEEIDDGVNNVTFTYSYDELHRLIGEQSTAPPPSTIERVTSGLLTLYDFQEGSGNTVYDLSGVSPSLDLIIQNESAVSWLSGGGLSVDSSTLIKAYDPAFKIIDACKASNAITIEAWIKPANTGMDGPARIVTLSKDTSYRNFTLGQVLDAYDVRLRTTDTDRNGKPTDRTASGELTTNLTHVVHTSDAAGNRSIYLNGVLVYTDTKTGDFSNWGDWYFAIANETTGNRAWLGEFHLVAVYDRALDAGEVAQNFNAGSNGLGGSGGDVGPITYTYNPIGNMMQRSVGANTFNYNYDGGNGGISGPHAVDTIELNGTSYSYSYDANGNMISGQDFTVSSNPALRTITWNADNMPVSVNRNGVTTTFKYDGVGKRVEKRVGSSSPTRYISDGHEVIAGTNTTYVFAGNLRIAKVSSAGVYYFHKDHLGSSTVITDNTGNVVEKSEYRPYGSIRNMAGAVVSDYKFTDQEYDSSSGLYNYDARLYDPIVGRFISADSIVPEPFNPQSLNRYSYVYNNPLKYTDPTGHWGSMGSSYGGDLGGEVDPSDPDAHNDPTPGNTVDGGYGWKGNKWGYYEDDISKFRNYKPFDYEESPYIRNIEWPEIDWSPQVAVYGISGDFFTPIGGIGVDLGIYHGARNGKFGFYGSFEYGPGVDIGIDFESGYADNVSELNGDFKGVEFGAEGVSVNHSWGSTGGSTTTGNVGTSNPGLPQGHVFKGKGGSLDVLH